MSRPEYVVVHQRAWMNEHGYGINYLSDLVRWSSRRQAIVYGFSQADSDDFNVATLRGGKLVAFGWMDKDFAPEDTELYEIARQLSLSVGVPDGTRP